MPSSGYTAVSFVTDELLTSTKMNLMGANDASFNNGNGFNDSAIITRHIATNAVDATKLATSAIKLGYAQITANFATSSTTYVQVTGLTAAVTIPAGGRMIEIEAYATSLGSGTAANGGVLSIWDGTVGSGTQLGQANSVPTSGVLNAFCIAKAYVTPSAGAKTYNIGLLASPGGTVTLINSATSPAYIIVKVI